MRFLDHQPAPHIGLAGAQLRIGGDMRGSLAVRQADVERALVHPLGAGTVLVAFAVVIGDDHTTALDRLAKELVQQPHSRRCPLKPSATRSD